MKYFNISFFAIPAYNILALAYELYMILINPRWMPVNKNSSLNWPHGPLSLSVTLTMCLFWYWYFWILLHKFAYCWILLHDFILSRSLLFKHASPQVSLPFQLAIALGSPLAKVKYNLYTNHTSVALTHLSVSCIGYIWGLQSLSEILEWVIIVL